MTHPASLINLSLSISKNEQEAEKLATSDSSLVKFAKDVNGLDLPKKS